MWIEHVKTHVYCLDKLKKQLYLHFLNGKKPLQVFPAHLGLHSRSEL